MVIRALSPYLVMLIMERKLARQSFPAQLFTGQVTTMNSWVEQIFHFSDVS